jgi:putative DNA primase/helicase
MTRARSGHSAGERLGDKAVIKGVLARDAALYGIAPEPALRLASWSTEIAEAMLPEGTPAQVLEGETRFGRKQSLAVYHDGSWHNYEGGEHGHSALSLIAHLQQDSTPATVQAFARAWLQEHPGHGTHALEGNSNDASVSDRDRRNAEWGQRVLADVVPLAGTPGEANLRSRGLVIPPDGVAAYLPRARLGEGALVGMLRRSDGRVVGSQLTYIDPVGAKSALPPRRNRFMTELNPLMRQDAAFRIAGRPVPVSDNKGNGHEHAILVDPAQEQIARDHAEVILFTEGLENAIALHMAMPYSSTVGYPGIGALQHQKVKAGQKIAVFKDGDAVDAPAVKALTRGIDHLLVGNAMVKVTNTPARQSESDIKQDANTVLQAGGIAAVQAMILGALPATLSDDGEITRLATLRRAGAQLEYEQGRVEVAKKLGIRRITQLDAMVARKLGPVITDEMEFDPLSDLPWGSEIADLGAVLDEALATSKRFVAADDAYLAANVVWAAHTHLVHSETVFLLVTPRLLITAAAENSGKTTLLKISKHLSARGLMFVNMTPASLFRVFDDLRPTICVDEADNAFARGANAELLSLINAGHERGSFVTRVEEIDGARVPQFFGVWGAIALAAIGRLPAATTQSRCIVVPLKRAWGGQIPERLRPGMEDVFVPIRRKLVRWAQDITDLPEPRKLPGLDNRIGDNWEPLLQIAELAGGRWPELITRAARLDAADSRDVGTLTPLLTDIREVFGAQAQLTTTELIEGLLGLEEPSAEWDRSNRGREITHVWLSRTLRGVLPDTPEARRARQWRVGKKTQRGYPVEQFDDAFRRYLPATDDSDSDEAPVPSVIVASPASVCPECPELSRLDFDQSGQKVRSPDMQKSEIHPSVPSHLQGTYTIHIVEESDNLTSHDNEVTRPIDKSINSTDGTASEDVTDEPERW